MANNTYIIDRLAPVGVPVTIADASGTDWLTVAGTYQKPTSITLFWDNASGKATAASGIWFANPPSLASGQLIVRGLIENARGSNGADEIVGNHIGNLIYGDKAVGGSGGNDGVFALGGRDTVFGGRGDDRISGGDGNDQLFGNAGKDTVTGDDGADIVEGGQGADTLSGGADRGDTLSYKSSAGAVSVTFNHGKIMIAKGGDAQGDSITGFLNIIGSRGSDILTDAIKGTPLLRFGDNAFSGGAGHDTLALGGGNDRGYGETGNDKLLGELGSDDLFGGNGNDQLTGGLGRDKLTGGLGSDRFKVTSVEESGLAVSARDTIYDFSRTERDRIDLSGIDAKSAASGNNAFSFVGSATFRGGEGELRIIKMASDTIAQGDVDGDRRADFAIHLDDRVNLAAGDFVL